MCSRLVCVVFVLVCVGVCVGVRVVCGTCSSLCWYCL